MSILIRDCCAVLLWGGKSRRMGRDKGLLPWGDSTFLEAIASQMDLFEEKYLSVAASAAEGGAEESAADLPEPGLRGGSGPEGAESCRRLLAEEGWVLLPDLIPDCGPMGGIWTALSSCRAEWVLAVSCDIPAVRSRLFQILLEMRGEDTDLICPVTPDGRRHMTCALYRKTLAPVLKRQILSGDLRMRVLCSLCRSKEVSIEEPALIEMLTNLNTRDEMRLAYRIKKKRAGKDICLPEENGVKQEISRTVGTENTEDD